MSGFNINSSAGAHLPSLCYIRLWLQIIRINSLFVLVRFFFWRYLKSNITSSILSFNFRHSTNLESDSHHLLGFKLVWYFLHSGVPRALLHRRVHRLLHHHPPLPLLPHLSQHACLPTEPEGTHLVPHVLLFWVQCKRACSQPVSLALQQACLHENSDWIECSFRDQKLQCAWTVTWLRNSCLRCCFSSLDGSKFITWEFSPPRLYKWIIFILSTEKIEATLKPAAG